MNKFILFIFACVFAINTVSAQKKSTHRVRIGESFFSIAKKYNCTIDEIYILNPNLKGKSLGVNTIIKIPNNTNQVVNPKTHTVSSGESLYSISKKHGLTLDELQKLNPDVNSKNLQKGMNLVLEKGTSEKEKNNSSTNVLNETKSNQYKEVFHTVEKKETLRSIAKKYKITINTLKKLNPKLKDKPVVGSKLLVTREIIFETQKTKIIPQNSNEFLGLVSYDDHIEEEDDSGDIKHVVIKGETLYSISKKYNLKVDELKALNPRVTDNVKVGRVLLIQKNAVIEAASSKVVYAELEEYVEDSDPLDAEELTRAERIINKSEEAIGVRYRMGGTTTSGFDCSGLMLFAYNEIDLKLPRTSAQQSRFGKKVKKTQAQKGDLIFFTTNGRGYINHVGMVTDVEDGEINFIHASSSRGVIISSLNESYWSKRFVKINRVLKK